ncbi:MAG: hypothetical protein KBF26_01930 [Opitutaceae bacterium]|nr:hypothetical protein [Opitutaceae bacterium]
MRFTRSNVLVLFALFGTAFGVSLHADSRTAASYRLTTESVDGGGQRAASAAYVNDGSVGGIAGLASAAVPATTLKAGYVGQLYQATGLAVSAAPVTVNEAGARQLNAALQHDDDTTLELAASAVGWTVMHGPIVGISADGVVTAARVYQNAPASVQGAYGGFTATVNLTVLNVTSDDLGSYAGDGLPDDWQALHYGLDNPNAAPDAAPDGTGESNRFKYAAGLIPFDANSHFTTTVEPVAGQPGYFAVVFSPLAAGRTYLVQFTDNLSTGSWTELTGGTVTDNGGTRTVTDPVPLGVARFYRVQIVAP